MEKREAFKSLHRLLSASGVRNGNKYSETDALRVKLTEKVGIETVTIIYLFFMC